MKPFLEKLAETLYNKYGDDISSVQLIFPSRRAGLYFKHYLSGLIKAPLWSPVTCSISEFIREHAPCTVADDLTLIFELYEIYKKYNPDVSFDKFYPWGEIILRDFDETDKNLVQAGYLFRILKEHKKVEEDFDFNAADIDEFYRFWQSFSFKEINKLEDDFIKTWEVLGKVYNEYRTALEGKNICYEGMAYRLLYENIKNGSFKPEKKKYIFAGFNLLNKCEENILSELLKQGIAETFWDADNFYLKDTSREAGKFLRSNFARLNIGQPDWKTDDLTKSAKNIKIIGSPLEVSQAKILGNELSAIPADKLMRTAVVLPDDTMLIPVLHSLPENVEKINITMGYSFKNSMLYSFIDALKNLQAGAKGKGSSAVFYHRDVLNILQHPFIRKFSNIAAGKAVNTINKRNIVYVSGNMLLKLFDDTVGIIAQIFKTAESSTEALDYFNAILISLFKIVTVENINDINSSSGNITGNNIYEAEFLNKAYAELNRINDLLADYSSDVSRDTFWNILIECFRSIKIPFSGEPLEGLQVMGMLETRLLDFENVFILSVNEGILPPEAGSSSFIPYSLKKAFRLPVPEDIEADYAYYFYRLLQKAENVTLIYNTETGVIKAGEKSRFIMQVVNELAEENNNIKVEELLLSGDIELPVRKEISIEKTDEVIKILKDQKQYSATTILSYINCPLQFYFKKAAGLKEEDEVEEYFSAAAFGNIFHQVMEDLYTGDTGKDVTAAMIDEKLNLAKNNFDELWKAACSKYEEYAEFSDVKIGKNLLYKRVIQKLVQKVLQADKEQAPFKILALEIEAERELIIKANGESYTVKLFGRLDRIEQKEGITRIVDYKSGTVDLKNKPVKISDNEHIDNMFENIKRKENFQQMFYASLYLNTNKNQKLIIGVYPLKKLSGGIFWFEDEPITPDKKEYFDSKLTALFTEIFDKNTPFRQTRDAEHCTYCPYISLCYRN